MELSSFELELLIKELEQVLEDIRLRKSSSPFICEKRQKSTNCKYKQGMLEKLCEKCGGTGLKQD